MRCPWLAGITRDGASMPVYIALNGEPTRMTRVWTNVPDVDFNGNGRLDEVDVDVDINNVQSNLPPSPHGWHEEHNDWANIKLNFQKSLSLPDKVHVLCP